MTRTRADVLREFGLVERDHSVWQVHAEGVESRGAFGATVCQMADRVLALEADAARLNWLEAMASKPSGLLLHDGSESGRAVLGLRPGALVRNLRAAIDAAMHPTTTREDK